MHPIKFISNAISVEQSPRPDIGTEIGVCCISGDHDECVKRNSIITNMFSNADLFDAPSSRLISVDAYRVLKYRPERASSWICDGNQFTLIRRLDVRDIVINERYPSKWCGYVTTSYKKHGSLFVKINSEKSRVWRFEQLDVDVSDHENLINTWDRMNYFLSIGIGKVTFETLFCYPNIVRKIGPGKCNDFLEWARGIYLSPVYRFLCYLLPSKDELKIKKDSECCNFDSIDFFNAVS
jgi:hypothetical protein